MIKNLHSTRTIARIVGVIFLVGMVVGIGGNILIQSILTAPGYLSTVYANSILLALGAVLWLMTVAGDAAHGVLMFPILKQQSERLAIGYLASRIVDAVFIGLFVLFVLIQIPLGHEYLKSVPDNAYLQALSTISTQASLYSYNIAMIALGIAGFMLCYGLYKAKLVPRWVATWGLVGYAVIFGGSVVEVLGYNLQSIHTIPGGLWELFIGVWLIVKGFNEPITPASTKTNN
jgi:hypothetical protein